MEAIYPNLEEEAKSIANDMSGTANIEFWEREEMSGKSDRFTFRYDDGAVHAHGLKGDWTVVGFGSSWFAIAQR